MSWEGYSQNFCANGHFFQGSAGFDSEPTHCPHCKAEVAYCHIVDDTNIDALGHLTDESLAALVIEKEVTETCNLGHTHIVKHAVYKVPTREELRALEHFWTGSKFLPMSEHQKWCEEMYGS